MDAAAALKCSLFTGAGWSYSTIQENGYPRWYHVGSAAGKTMSVHTAGTGGSRSMTPRGRVVASSVLWGRHLRHTPPAAAWWSLPVIQCRFTCPSAPESFFTFYACKGPLPVRGGTSLAE